MPTKKKTTKKKKANDKVKDKENTTYKKETRSGSGFDFSQTSLEKVGKKARGLEDVEFEDIIIPRLIIAQALSPIVIDDPDIYRPGMLVNSVTNDILAKQGKNVKVQFIGFHKSRILWIPKDEGGGQKCQAAGGKVSNAGEFIGKKCSECGFSIWNGNNPPKCTMYYNFPFLIYGDNINKHNLMWVSLGRTNAPAGKKLLNTITHIGEDIFNRWIEIETIKTSNEKGTFFTFKAHVKEQVNEEYYKVGENAYKFLQSMKDQVKYSGVETEKETEEEGSINTEI